MTEQRRAALVRAWLRGCEAGVGIQLHGRPEIHFDGGSVHIGDRCTLASLPVTTHMVAGPGARLDIRNDVSIGHGGAIAAYERVEIGEGTAIGPFVIIMDTNFHGNTGDQSVHHDCRPVVIGARCRIGSRVTITRGASIGDGAEILAGSVVSSPIPAGVCAGGARARVLGAVGDIGLRWDSAAAVLPVLMMECLGLDSPAPLAARPADLPDWTPAAAECVRVAVSTRFGASIATALDETLPVSELAARIDAARHGARTGESGRT